MSLSMEPLVSCTPKWQETIVPLLIPFLSSEPQFSIKRRRSEDQEAFNTGTTMLSSQFSELPPEPATKDTDQCSRPTDPIPLDNDPQFELK